MVRDEEEVGEMEEGGRECGCEEWQEGVLRAERPAERAICRSGTEGRERSVLCVWVKIRASVGQRVGL